MRRVEKRWALLDSEQSGLTPASSESVSSQLFAGSKFQFVRTELI
jgi:hypothetical protein